MTDETKANDSKTPDSEQARRSSHCSDAPPIKRTYFSFHGRTETPRDPTMIVGKCKNGHRGLVWINPVTGKPESEFVTNCLACRSMVFA